MDALTFNFIGKPTGPLSEQFGEALGTVLIQEGHTPSENNANVVFGFYGPEDSAWMVRDAIQDPRRQKPVAIVEWALSLEGVAGLDGKIQRIWDTWDSTHLYVDRVLAVTYPQLALKLAPEGINLFPGRPPKVVCTGMEGSHPRLLIEDFEETVKVLWSNVIEQRVRSHLMLDYVASNELPREVWEGTETTGQLRAVLGLLPPLKLLPPAFPFQEALRILQGKGEGPKKARYLRAALDMAGVSFGMASMAARHPSLPTGSFWVSASGVKKDELPSVKEGGMQLVVGWARKDVPEVWRVPGSGRPSVETAENLKIREALREIRDDLVCDVLHAHAWILEAPSWVALDTVESGATCGTKELAEATATKAAQALQEIPQRAKEVVIALNQLRHGFTIVAGTKRDSRRTGMTIILDLLIRGDRREPDGIWFKQSIPQPIQAKWV